MWDWPGRRQRREHLAALARIERLEADNRRLLARAQNAENRVANLLEPTPANAGRCVKARWHSQGEAEAFGRALEERYGGGRLDAYPCRVCPPQPWWKEPFWHAGHPRENGELARLTRDGLRGHGMVTPLDQGALRRARERLVDDN